MKKNIAIILYGLTRGQAKLTSESFRKYLVEPLSESYNTQIFLQALTMDKLKVCDRQLPPLNQKMARTVVEIEDIDDWKLFNPNKSKAINQEKFRETIDFPKYIQNHVDPYRNGYASVRNYLTALHSLKESFSLSLESSFDCYIILRLDLLFQSNTDILKSIQYLINNPDSKFLFTPGWATHRGYNDRMAIAKFNEAKVYCNRIDDYIECSNHEHKFSHYNIHSEIILKMILSKYGISSKWVKAYAARIRADGSVLDS